MRFDVDCFRHIFRHLAEEHAQGKERPPPISLRAVSISLLQYLFANSTNYWRGSVFVNFNLAKLESRQSHFLKRISNPLRNDPGLTTAVPTPSIQDGRASGKLTGES